MPMGKGYYKYEAKPDSGPSMGRENGMQAESPRKKMRRGKKKGKIMKNSSAKTA